MSTTTMYEIDYTKPKVTLLQHSGVGVAEMAARTCYDSFENSENSCIQEAMQELNRDAINQIDDSALLHSLAWVHHHHSIMEHATLSYLIQGTSRGVLQEHARHRIQAISVRSTRYTMSSVIHAFVASTLAPEPFSFFLEKVKALDLFVIADETYMAIEIKAMYDKLQFQFTKSEAFMELALAKSSFSLLESHSDASELYTALESGKKKRNVGDAFKHIVSDNWKVDMVVTFNIRSLKNYFELRDSGAAWFQIRWLAQAMKEVTPIKYLKLIDKNYK
jgi:thymidylate synthase (FAD)